MSSGDTSPMPQLRQAERVWSRLERSLGVAAAIVLLAMMCLTGLDVIARYIFNAPIQGAFELTQVLLVLLVYLAMPLATRGNAHVEVEIWEPGSRFSQRFRAVLVGLGGIAVFAGLAWQLAEHGGRLASRVAVTNALGIPLAWIAFVASICCAVCVVAVVLNYLQGKTDA